MPRKGENIYKRADGRWEGRYVADHSMMNGKAKYGYIYGRTYTEVKQKKAAATRMVWQPKQKVITLGLLSEEWLSWKKSDPSLHESTLQQYQHRIEKHILPTLGLTQVAHLNSRALDQFRATLLHEGRLDGSGGLAPRTAEVVLSIVFSILHYAQDEGYIGEVPRRKTKSSFKPRNDARVFSRAEQSLLEDYICARLHSAEDQGVYMGIFFTLYTGLRVGELGALRWKDVDFSGPSVAIRGTVQRLSVVGGETKTRLNFGPPKSAASQRSFPLKDGLAKILQRYHSSLPSGLRQRDSLVFTFKGKCIEPRIFQNQFKRLLKSAGIEDANFHALRHTFATRCIESGMDVQSLSECLGHSNSAITLKVYSHSFAEQKKSCMNRLGFVSSASDNLAMSRQVS